MILACEANPLNQVAFFEDTMTGLLPYRSTPVFDQNTLPSALQGRHKTKAGVWGLIRVLDGEVKLTYLDPLSEQILEKGASALVLPRQPHFVTPLGEMKMQVDFYDKDPTAAEA